MNRNIITLLFTIFSFQVFSQNVLNKKIKVHSENETIETILWKIEDEFGVNFSYNPQEFQTDSLINEYNSSGKLTTILNELISSKYEFYEVGSHIVIKKKNYFKEKSKIQISGTITSYSNEKINNASIVQLKETRSTLTDSKGKFNLKILIDDAYENILISKSGYFDTIINVSPSSFNTDFNIKLRKKHEDLSVLQPRKINFSKHYQPLDNIGVVMFFVPDDNMYINENFDYLLQRRIAQISILPGIGTNRKMDALIENHFSINVFGGQSKSIKGYEMAGLVNITRENVQGVQIAGIGNVVGGKIKGVQFAGIFNNSRFDVHGGQVAGISNLILDTLKGFQFAGIANNVYGKSIGIQVAGIYNFVTQSIDGAQLAGISNIALDSAGKVQIAGISNYGKNLDGLQIAGIVNASVGNTKGVQIAGIANVTTKNLDGLQMSSIVNIAKKVKGVQIGVVNIADTVDGASIGIFTYVKKGYRALEISNDELFYISTAFKTGVDKFYNIFSYSANLNHNHFGYGLGRKMKLNEKLSIEIDFTSGVIYSLKKSTTFGVLNRGSLLLNLNHLNKFSVFFGPTLNHYLVEHKNSLADLQTPNSFFDLKTKSDIHTAWFGYKIGFRYNFFTTK